MFQQLHLTGIDTENWLGVGVRVLKIYIPPKIGEVLSGLDHLNSLLTFYGRK